MIVAFLFPNQWTLIDMLLLWNFYLVIHCKYSTGRHWTEFILIFKRVLFPEKN